MVSCFVHKDPRFRVRLSPFLGLLFVSCGSCDKDPTRTAVDMRAGGLVKQFVYSGIFIGSAESVNCIPSSGDRLEL